MKLLPTFQNPSKYFLPYQIRWLKDDWPLKIIEKLRQIGMTYVDAQLHGGIQPNLFRNRELFVRSLPNALFSGGLSTSAERAAKLAQTLFAPTLFEFCLSGANSGFTGWRLVHICSVR